MSAPADKPPPTHFVMRCAECEMCFGRPSAAAGECPHCGSAAEHRLVERVSDVEELQTRVALANLPEGLKGQLEQRVIDDAAELPNEIEPPKLTSQRMAELLTNLSMSGDVFDERTVQSELDKMGIGEPNAAELCETWAAAGMLLDLGEGGWQLL